MLNKTLLNGVILSENYTKSNVRNKDGKDFTPLKKKKKLMHALEVSSYN